MAGWAAAPGPHRGEGGNGRHRCARLREIDELRQHFDQIRAEVINGYPDNVDETALRNWILLAAIDALVHGQRDTANYHLAWFKALVDDDHR